jgi:hypothetical protein
MVATISYEKFVSTLKIYDVIIQKTTIWTIPQDNKLLEYLSISLVALIATHIVKSGCEVLTGVTSSGMWHRVVWYKFSNISEESTASIFR